MDRYLYGVTAASHPLQLDGLTGVGGHTPGTVTAAGLAAVVGAAPDDLRAKRRDLLAHQRVVTTLHQQGTVLPMRFGLVLASPDDVRALLTRSRQPYTMMLAELDGCVELNVKLGYEEEALLREVLAEHEELRERNDALRRAGGGGYLERVRFGELVTGAVRSHLGHAGERVRHTLRPLSVREFVPPAAHGTPLNASFLVRRETAGQLGEAAARLDRELGDHLQVRCHGPLPPYSFVRATTTG